MDSEKALKNQTIRKGVNNQIKKLEGNPLVKEIHYAPLTDSSSNSKTFNKVLKDKIDIIA